MIDHDDLEAAVAGGAIDRATADRLRGFLEARRREEASPDDENLRLVRGFNDIFVTLGVALLFGALAYFALFRARPELWAAGAAAAWGLAEFFTRRRRMALPSIALLGAFAATGFLGLRALVDGARLGLDDSAVAAAAALMTVGAVALHWRRFRVPVTVAAGAAAGCGAVLSLAHAAAPDLVEAAWRPLLLACGIAVFALAMRFDVADRERVTRRTDIAFWLHLLAAPLIVHPIATALLRDGQDLTPAGGAALLALFAALAIVALVIDRRALLVSGLAYAGIAAGTLLGRSGLVSATVPASLLVLGAVVLGLSAGWRPLRAALLRPVPASLARLVPAPTLDPR
ncbi:MAG TPA: hypothetical protein VEA41_20890 [Salinarimonas sp.]|nr:hypothetical protein [Salinarimonas sp.]